MNAIAARLMSSAYPLLVLAPTFWAGNVVAGKLAVGNIDPTLLVFYRWTGAVLFLCTIALPHVKRDWQKLRPALPWLAYFGFIGFAAFNLLMYQAAHHTAAVNASIEQAAIPVIVLLGNFIFFKVRARLLQVLGLAFTVIGVIWVATHGDPARIVALSVNIGDGMVLLACLAYATYSLALRFKPDVHWLSFLMVTAGFALLATLLYMASFGGGLSLILYETPDITPMGWLLALYVMIFPSMIAQLFYARGVELVGPNRASIFINLLPVLGTIFSVIIVGEGLEAYHIVAAGLVVIGIVLAEWSVRRV